MRNTAMDLAKTVRSFGTGIAFPAIKIKAWSVRIAATAFCLFGALVLTATRVETTRLSYELNEYNKSRSQLMADVARLELEIANLARPQRIAELARRMGLADPRSDQVIVMDE